MNIGGQGEYSPTFTEPEANNCSTLKRSWTVRFSKPRGGDYFMKRLGCLSSQVQIKGVDDEKLPFLTVEVSFRVHLKQ